MADEFGFHSRREGQVSPDQGHMFDPEPFKTGWTKEEGDANLRKIWDRIDSTSSFFHDRRS